MDIEKYVLDNYLNKIIKVNDNGKKYILEEDIDSLNFSVNEKKFVFQLMEKYRIGLVRDVKTKEDRPMTIRDYEYGEMKANDIEDRDIPEKATIEYNEDGLLVFENYEKLKDFIEKDFIPNNIFMTKKRDSDDPDKQFVGFIETKNGLRKKYEKQLYPTIQLRQIVSLRLSEKETNYVIKYLENSDIMVRGKNSSIDQGFENYDYYVTYKNQVLPKPLTKEESNQKFALYSVTKDPVIREQLIISNLRLVPYVAWKYAVFYDKDISEVESYGYEGLIEAVDRFDPGLGNNFSTYAISYIEGFIKRGRASMDYLNGGVWANTFYKCKQVVEELSGENLEENLELANDIVELMTEVGEAERSINPKAAVAINSRADVKDSIEKIKFMYSSNIDDFVLDSNLEMEDISSDFVELEDIKSNIENYVVNESLKEVLSAELSTLTQREEKVLRLRFGLDDGSCKTLTEVAEMLGVTIDRVRMMEQKALRKLRNPSRSRKLKAYVGMEESYAFKNKKSEGSIDNFANEFSSIEEFQCWYKDFCNRWNSTAREFKR